MERCFVFFYNAFCRVNCIFPLGNVRKMLANVLTRFLVGQDYNANRSGLQRVFSLIL